MIQSAMQSLAAFLTLCLVLMSSSRVARGGQELFNAHNLGGWQGDPQIWTVPDGLLTGQTKSAHDIDSNTFVISKEFEVEDFDLHVVFRLDGDNSGVQYRSQILAQRGRKVTIAANGSREMRVLTRHRARNSDARSLFNTLEEDELSDLVAFLLSRGDSANPMFVSQNSVVGSSSVLRSSHPRRAIFVLHNDALGKQITRVNWWPRAVTLYA